MHEVRRLSGNIFCNFEHLHLGVLVTLAHLCLHSLVFSCEHSEIRQQGVLSQLLHCFKALMQPVYGRECLLRIHRTWLSHCVN